LVSGVVNCRYPWLSVASHLGSLKNQGGLLPAQVQGQGISRRMEGNSKGNWKLRADAKNEKTKTKAKPSALAGSWEQAASCKLGLGAGAATATATGTGW